MKVIYLIIVMIFLKERFINMDYDSLIKENEWLIYSLIKKYPNYNKEDLYQAGIIGIIKAYKKYNSNIGIKFSTYAYKYILGEIIKCISEQRNIQVSEDYISISKRYLQVKKLLTDKYNREATFKEICEVLDVSESRISQLHGKANLRLRAKLTNLRKGII